MESPAGEVLFREEQRFDRGWFWLAILIGGSHAAIFGIALWQQLWKGIPFGNNPVSDGKLLAIAVGALAVTGTIAWLLGAANLVTEVRPGLLSLHFRPFRRKAIPLSQIVRAEVRRYRPIGEFGGWGLRTGLGGGGAWNVSGDMGVQLELEGGGRFLVGSQRPDEMKAALDRAR